MTRTKWAAQPDGSVVATVDGATMRLWQKYEGVAAWWQSATVGRWTRISGIAHACWTLRGAKLRAQWMRRQLTKEGAS